MMSFFKILSANQSKKQKRKESPPNSKRRRQMSLVKEEKEKGKISWDEKKTQIEIAENLARVYRDGGKLAFSIVWSKEAFMLLENLGLIPLENSISVPINCPGCSYPAAWDKSNNSFLNPCR